jgi:hypothetical protein
MRLKALEMAAMKEGGAASQAGRLVLGQCLRQSQRHRKKEMMRG